jgi:hypothetical protein
MNAVSSVRRKIPVNAGERKVTYDNELSNIRIQEKEEKRNKTLHSYSDEFQGDDDRLDKDMLLCYMLVQDATNVY